MREYGIFTDEGMIDGPIYTQEDAAKTLTYWLEQGETATVEETCPEHNEEPAAYCNECFTEE